MRHFLTFGVGVLLQAPVLTYAAAIPPRDTPINTINSPPTTKPTPTPTATTNLPSPVLATPEPTTSIQIPSSSGGSPPPAPPPLPSHQPTDESKSPKADKGDDTQNDQQGDLQKEFSSLSALRAQLVALSREVQTREAWLRDVLVSSSSSSSSLTNPRAASVAAAGAAAATAQQAESGGVGRLHTQPRTMGECDGLVCVGRLYLRKVRRALGRRDDSSGVPYYSTTGSTGSTDIQSTRTLEEEVGEAVKKNKRGVSIPRPPWRVAAAADDDGGKKIRSPRGWEVNDDDDDGLGVDDRPHINIVHHHNHTEKEEQGFDPLLVGACAAVAMAMLILLATGIGTGTCVSGCGGSGTGERWALCGCFGCSARHPHRQGRMSLPVGADGVGGERGMMREHRVTIPPPIPSPSPSPWSGYRQYTDMMIDSRYPSVREEEVVRRQDTIPWPAYTDDMEEQQPVESEDMTVPCPGYYDAHAINHLSQPRPGMDNDIHPCTPDKDEKEKEGSIVWGEKQPQQPQLVFHPEEEGKQQSQQALIMPAEEPGPEIQQQTEPEPGLEESEPPSSEEEEEEEEDSADSEPESESEESTIGDELASFRSAVDFVEALIANQEARMSSAARRV